MKIRHLNIPRPCNHDWSQMTAIESGRHCQSCCKTVVDFTRMSNDQVINYLSKENRICGRFNDAQFHNLNSRLLNAKTETRWRKWLVAMALLGTTMTAKATSQPAGTVSATSMQLPADKSQKVHGEIKQDSDSLRYRTVKGQILDETNQPIPGAQVMAQGTSLGTATGIDGKFTLKVPSGVQELRVYFIGYQIKSVAVNDHVDTAGIVQMKLSPMIMGDVVIIRQSFFKRVYYKFIKRPIYKVFGIKRHK